MEEFIKIVLLSGKTALELALYVLLPVLVIMMALMKVVEARGVLALIARLVQPVLRVFGVPGAGAFAIMQLLFVSFAAPLATLAIMEKDGTSRRRIAATLAMVFTMSQANVVFPMVAAGLNLGVIMLTSLVGGLSAAALTYYLFARSAGDEAPPRRTVRSNSRQTAQEYRSQPDDLWRTGGGSSHTWRYSYSDFGNLPGERSQSHRCHRPD